MISFQPYLIYTGTYNFNHTNPKTAISNRVDLRNSFFPQFTLN